MENSPFSLAHFHERKAGKLIKQHRYEEAIQSIETSLSCVEEAYKNAKIPQTIAVLDAQKWEYERKLNYMRRLQCEKMKSKEVKVVHKNIKSNNINTVNGQPIGRSIDKTIEEFNDKYSSILLENNQQLELQTKKSDPNNFSINVTAKIAKEIPTENLETNMSHLSILDNNLQTGNENFPFPPLIFSVTPGLVENFQK